MPTTRCKAAVVVGSTTTEVEVVVIEVPEVATTTTTIEAVVTILITGLVIITKGEIIITKVAIASTKVGKVSTVAITLTKETRTKVGCNRLRGWVANKGSITRVDSITLWLPHKAKTMLAWARVANLSQWANLWA